VKLSWNKKFTERFKPSKARRSWNGACELLRRGISSPMPVAYFEKRSEADLLRNWYICEREASNLSVRHYFMIYASGNSIAHGIARDDFLAQLCQFVLEIHQRGIFFRDLSGGNVLVKTGSDGRLMFSLIDTARARFFPFAIPVRKRLADLVRILHKLDWPGRLVFLQEYCNAIDKKFTVIWRLPFYLYDLKAGSKRGLRTRKRKT
ncbi:MAG: lipopolysaccharide kinase InaA family protein, partial [Pseudomonadales bacterium]|nr:lipopolysaccharide kinase InaA family protein [Pseudomonadales bacterium]